MPTPQLQIGLEFNGYRLEEKLHTGGMAVLWRITDLRDRHALTCPADGGVPSLIMKVPLLNASDDATAIVAFEVEQMIMPKLKGQHVPRYFDAGDFDSQPYIVMECIAGQSLRERFEQAPLPLVEVIQIGTQVAYALQDLHRQHVLHLDIKPSNIMLRKGHAVLIDFGLSHHARLPDLLDEEFHLPMGTGSYIAPEQVLGIRNEPRSDLFSLGVLLYHLATGARPYGYPQSVSGLKKRLFRDPIPPRKLRPELPAWFQEIVLRCLEVQPGERFETAGQLAFLLQHPAQIKLTSRAEKMQQDGWWRVLKRRFFAAGLDAQKRPGIQEQLAKAPIIVVALDLAHTPAELGDSLRNYTRRMLETQPGARLACVCIRKSNRLGMDESLIQHGENIHVKQLVELKHWAQALHTQADKITFHVLEASDVASTILDYAHNNQVDHIIVGARGNSALRRYLGSVSTQVVAEAECTVTVVRHHAKS